MPTGKARTGWLGIAAHTAQKEGAPGQTTRWMAPKEQDPSLSLDYMCTQIQAPTYTPPPKMKKMMDKESHILFTRT